jgi:hypothetical protein
MSNKDITIEDLQEVLKEQGTKMGFKGMESLDEAVIDPELLKRPTLFVEPINARKVSLSLTNPTLFVEVVLDSKTGKLLWTEKYEFSRLNGLGERFIRQWITYKVVGVEVTEGKSVTFIEYVVENLGKL